MKAKPLSLSFDIYCIEHWLVFVLGGLQAKITTWCAWQTQLMNCISILLLKSSLGCSDH